MHKVAGLIARAHDANLPRPRRLPGSAAARADNISRRLRVRLSSSMIFPSFINYFFCFRTNVLAFLLKPLEIPMTKCHWLRMLLKTILRPHRETFYFLYRLIRWILLARMPLQYVFFFYLLSFYLFSWIGPQWLYRLWSFTPSWKL